VNTAERSFIILKHVNKTPSLAACSKCERKFFTPTAYYNDHIGAEQYLQGKFDLHRCPEEAHVQVVRRC
jgi:hypothetical protein